MEFIYLFICSLIYIIYINMFQNIDSNSDDNRGLASADKDTRERVASEGGKASHKNDNKD
jgi:hypothetical protein